MVPVSPANSDSQDSGAADFDVDVDGDDDGFIDAVQAEQEKVSCLWIEQEL